jgi:hypothetical protein
MSGTCGCCGRGRRTVDNVSLFAQWFPIDSVVEVELTYDATAMNDLLCGTVVLVTPIGVILDTADDQVFVPWGSIGTMRRGKGTVRS